VDQSLSQREGQNAQRKSNPRGVFFLFLGLMLLSLGSFAVILAVIVPPYDQSAYTQAHGLLRSGIVTSVANHEGRSHTASVGVRLTKSVAGHTTTTARIPALVSLSPGAAVQVLVDPQDPGYAELPRQQLVLKSSVQLAVIVSLVCLAVLTSGTVISAWAWRRQHRERGHAAGT
jgi:hypothetical protein